MKNILHWGIENIAQPVTGWLEEQAEESPNIVSSSGYSWSAAFGASGAHSIGITRDTKGNIGIIFTDAVGGGFPTASFSSYYNVTFASDIYSQRGVSTILGGSINTPIVGVGGEGSFFTDPNTGAFCGGVSVMAGVGTSFPVEIHGEVAYSRVYGFNIFDIAHNVYDWILGW